MLSAEILLSSMLPAAYTRTRAHAHRFLALVVAAGLAGCTTTTAAQHQQQLGSTSERELTVGVVQKEIHAGMSGDEVVSTLGSPNIVTRDAAGQETWVYDKIASEASYSQSQAYNTVLLLGTSSAAGASSTSQKTLTVVIKFGGDQRVESFSYHASRF
jgi:outer membrane protein assembly factor BamE (lipoprotein component of BamABCDE complex)